MLALLPMLLSLGLAPAQETDEIVLHEPSTGATLVLPEDWSFAKGAEGLMGLSENRRGFVLLAGSDEEFDALREDVKALILERLDKVAVARTRVLGVNEVGAIEEIVEVRGTGVSRADGESVEFAGMLVRSGQKGVLVLGAWKDEAHAELVAGILAGFQIQETAGEAGLEIENKATGASVKLPKDWEVARSRKGLIAACPDGNAMAILMG